LASANHRAAAEQARLEESIKNMKEIIIDYGLNDIVTTLDGREYIDFSSGYGSVILGHANPAVNNALKSQIDKIWITPVYKTSNYGEVEHLIERYIPEGFFFSALYSTGMEAIEFTLRVAAIATGRKAYAGFDRSMHGKSLATSSLSWENPFGLDNFFTLPFIDSQPESELLERVEDLFRTQEIASLYLEPIQGSTGGLEASRHFYQEVIALCRAHGVLSVVDEVLTGFFRAGHASYCAEQGLSPDMIIFGKSIGNGFPVSAVVLRNNIEVQRSMLPNSTYSSNPLACSAVSATLKEISKLDIRGKIQNIHARTSETLEPLAELGFVIRGRGALWFIEPPGFEASRIGARIASSGTLTAFTTSHLRLMPTATISDANLTAGLNKVVEGCLGALNR
jgi:4-aminobutyrate aminotransferase-like enzyme